MDYVLPHAVLALLQEENSPQTPRSYFVRSGSNSTKITLIYTRRKRRDKTGPGAGNSARISSSFPSPCSSFSTASSATSTPNMAAAMQLSLDGLRTEGSLIAPAGGSSSSSADRRRSSVSVQDRSGNNSSCIDNMHSGGGQETSTLSVLRSTSHGSGAMHIDSSKDSALSRNGKKKRTSYVSSARRQLLGSISSPSSSDSSTDDYSGQQKCQQQAPKQQHQQQQQVEHKQRQQQQHYLAGTANHSHSTTFHHDNRERTQIATLERSLKRERSGSHPLQSSTLETSSANNKPCSAEQDMYQPKSRNNCNDERQDDPMEEDCPANQEAAPSGDADEQHVAYPCRRRERSDSHASRRTCVSTPGRGYGDSARVRGPEDPRTRIFYRHDGARTDPRRSSVSPRSTENFRYLHRGGGSEVGSENGSFYTEACCEDLPNQQDHLTISHNPSPCCDHPQNLHIHPDQSFKQKQQGESSICIDHHRPPQHHQNHQHVSENSAKNVLYKRQVSNNSTSGEARANSYKTVLTVETRDTKYHHRSPNHPHGTNRPESRERSNPTTSALTPPINPTRVIKVEGGGGSIPNSPRPPTPNLSGHQSDHLCAPSPVPRISPNPRHSPVPRHSPAPHHHAIDYDDDAPPPTPCIRSTAHCYSPPPTPLGSAFGNTCHEESSAEKFNSSVKRRLGAHLDQMNASSSHGIPPSSSKQTDASTPRSQHPPQAPKISLRPPSP